MIFKLPANQFRSVIFQWLILLLVFAATRMAFAQDAVLQLKNGDQISGVLMAVGTNQLVISNTWAGRIAVPVTQIAGCKAGTNIPPQIAAATASEKTNRPAKTNKPVTTSVAESRPAVLQQKQASSARPKPRGKWRGQVNVGLDSLVATKTQQNYYGKVQLTYLRSYVSNPKQFFRNTTQVSGQYQRTDGQESANRLNGKNKTDLDFASSYYGYSNVGGGYDEVRKIDFQFQVGPGLGRHLIQTDKTALNVESGLQYEAQYRQSSDNLESLYLRLAEDWSWKIVKNLSLNQKLAFYPDVEPVDSGQYRLEFASTLSYGFWGNLSLDLTLNDNYNTEVVSGVRRNEFETRLSLGATF